MRILLTAGQAHDLRAAPDLLTGLRGRYVVADRGYNADALLQLIKACGAKAHIPSTSRRLVLPSTDASTVNATSSSASSANSSIPGASPRASTSSSETSSPLSPSLQAASGPELMSPVLESAFNSGAARLLASAKRQRKPDPA